MKSPHIHGPARMYFLPRVAIGTVQPGTDHQPLLITLIEQLRQRDIEVQAFLSESHFGRKLNVASIAQPFVRHLDSWLMSEEVCREIFWYGAASSDLAIIEGQFACAKETQGGASLDQLCDWLDVPGIAVIDASRFDQTGLPARPPSVCAVILDHVTDEQHARQIQTTVESYWQVPVLGASLAWADPCHLRMDFDWLMNVAGQRSFQNVSHCLLQNHEEFDDLSVAVAFDEAFHCYFPDALDLLEMLGAAIYDFSPLRSDRLPDVDVVYLGSGPAENFAAELESNFCMKHALHAHVAAGRRVYAEGAGLAYLSEQMMVGNEQFSMCGLLPVVAQCEMDETFRAAELKLVRDNWLGCQQTGLRGYINSKWSVHRPNAKNKVNSMQLIGHHQVVGSCLNINFAAHPELLRSFFEPVVNLSSQLQAV